MEVWRLAGASHDIVLARMTGVRRFRKLQRHQSNLKPSDTWTQGSPVTCAIAAGTGKAACWKELGTQARLCTSEQTKAVGARFRPRTGPGLSKLQSCAPNDSNSLALAPFRMSQPGCIRNTRAPLNRKVLRNNAIGELWLHQSLDVMIQHHMRAKYGQTRADASHDSVHIRAFAHGQSGRRITGKTCLCRSTHENTLL